MRKIVLSAGLLIAGMMLAGSPAKAELGCACANKMGAAPVCMSGVSACAQAKGVCLLPCSYQPPKRAMQRRAKKQG